MGFASRLNVLTTPDTIWDRTRTQEGKHNIWLEEITCPLRYFSYKEWRSLRDEYIGSHLFSQWQKYAPNMTKENIIGTRIYTPVDLFETDPDMIEGSACIQAQIASQNESFRGWPDMSGYRTPIKNLYACGQSLPGGMGIARGSSYRCYRIIAEDYGLPRIWEERGW
jgi:phytoene dehydrogenase-like protein